MPSQHTPSPSLPTAGTPLHLSCDTCQPERERNDDDQRQYQPQICRVMSRLIEQGMIIPPNIAILSHISDCLNSKSWRDYRTLFELFHIHQACILALALKEKLYQNSIITALGKVETASTNVIPQLLLWLPSLARCCLTDS